MAKVAGRCGYCGGIIWEHGDAWTTPQYPGEEYCSFWCSKHRVSEGKTNPAWDEDGQDNKYNERMEL